MLNAVNCVAVIVILSVGKLSVNIVWLVNVMCHLTAVQTYKFDTGFICLDSWVGVLKNGVRLITLQFPDGARFVCF